MEGGGRRGSSGAWELRFYMLDVKYEVPFRHPHAGLGGRWTHIPGDSHVGELSRIRGSKVLGAAGALRSSVGRDGACHGPCPKVLPHLVLERGGSSEGG